MLFLFIIVNHVIAIPILTLSHARFSYVIIHLNEKI